MKYALVTGGSQRIEQRANLLLAFDRIGISEELAAFLFVDGFRRPGKRMITVRGHDYPCFI